MPSELPETTASRDISVPLIILSIILILIDILIRRFPEIIDKIVFALSKLKPNKKEILKINKKALPIKKIKTKRKNLILFQMKKRNPLRVHW